MGLEDPKPETSEPATEEPKQEPVIESQATTPLNQVVTSPDTFDPSVGDQPGGTALPAVDAHIKWTSVDQAHSEHSPIWYGAVLAVISLAILLLHFLTHDWLTIGVAVLVGGIFIYGVSHAPRSIDYTLDQHGIVVGRREYSYMSFKSFYVVDEANNHSLLLTPLKRYLPPLSLNCPPELLDDIASILGIYLPYEDRQPDSIDRLARRFRM